MRTLYGSTSWRRVLALVLVFVMMVSTMGTSGYSVFAEDLVETNEEVTVSEPEAIVPDVTEDIQGPSPGEDVNEAVVDPATDAEPVEASEDGEEPAADSELVETSEEGEEPAEEVAEPVEATEEGGEPADAEPVEETEEGEEPADAETVEETEEAEPAELAEDTLISEAAQVIAEDDGEAVAEPAEATEEVVEEELPEEEILEEEVSMPAIDAEKLFEDARVTVSAPEGAFPDGTTVAIEEVTLGRTQSAAIENAVEAKVVSYKAYDITFNNGDQTDMQPADGYTVKVNIEPYSMPAAENLQVVHMEDRKTAEVVESEATEEGLAFDAEHFSVYVVVETVVPRLTVNFVNGDNTVATMYVKAADTAAEVDKIIYDPGAGDLADNEVFKGWSETANYTAKTALLTIEEVREEVMDAAAELTADGSITYYAATFKQFNITYIAPIDLDVPGSTPVVVGTEVVEIPSRETSAAYTVNQGFSTDDTHNFDGWLVADGLSNITSPTATSTTLFSNGEKITIKGDVKFSVDAPKGHWLIFEENGKGATYNAPRFVKSGQNTSDEGLLDMVRKGYSFGGWYTDEDCTEGNEFSFGSTLSETTTIYAKWTAIDKADYTVLIWKQNVKGTENGKKVYDFVESVTIKDAEVGSTPDAVDSNGQVTGAEYEGEAGFSFAETDQASKTVAPEGTTVVNVYWDRIEYTLQFQAQGYSYNPTTGNNGTQYGLVDGQYVELNRHGRGNDTYWTYNDGWFEEGPRYTGTRYTRGNYGWQTVKTITALYGANIRNEFPIVGSNGVTYAGASWQSQGSSIFDNEAYVSYIDTMQAESTTFRLAANPQYSYYTYHVKYYVEALPEDTDTVSFNGKTFVLYHDAEIHSQSTLSSTESEEFTDITGFTKYGSYPAYENGRADFDDNRTISLYYTRNIYKINYMDGVYVDGNNNKLDVGTLQLHEEDNISYGADLKSYNPGGTDYYNPTAPTGYVFEGWYIDDACTTAYTFSTMPEGGLTVYAKWRQIQYRVFLHPNAGTDNTLDWGSEKQAMNFRVAYGGKISAPTGTRSGYEFYGWYTDPDCTQTFTDSTKIVSGTAYNKATDLTDNMTKWGTIEPSSPSPNGGVGYNSDSYNYDDKTGVFTAIDRFWITQRFDLYAKWSAIIVGADGIGIVYDPNGGSNPPSDTALYKDNTSVSAGAAATAPAGKVFDHWVLQTWNGTAFVDTQTIVSAGACFTALKDDAKITDATSGVVVAPANVVDTGTYNYTIQLKAIYKDKGVETPTHIDWFSNYGSENDGKGTQYKSYTDISINEAVDIIAAPTREGYTFKGWTKTKGGTTADFLIWTGSGYTDASGRTATQVAADEKDPIEDLFAVWEESTVIINYAVADGQVNMGSVALNEEGSTETSETIAATSGSAVGATATASAGYQFAYWTVDKGTESISSDAEFVPSKADSGVYEEHTYYAHFEPASYSVTYEYAGIVPSGLTPPAGSTQNYGDNVTVADEPAAVENYLFKGWEITSPEGMEIGNNSFEMPAANVTITGTWAEDKNNNQIDDQEDRFKVVYDLQGGTTESEATEFSGLKVGDQTPTITNPTKTGSTFGGWQPTVQTTVRAEDAKNSEDKLTITYTAQWTEEEYTLTYEYTGSVPAGVTAPTGGEHKYGDSIGAAPTPDPVTDYVFKGWDKADAFTMPAEDVTITGTWAEDKNNNQIDDQEDRFKVVYDLQGGTTESVATEFSGLKVGDQTPTITAPTKSGYNFSGWQPTVQTTVRAEDAKNSEDKLTITYTAQWTEAGDTPYTVKHFKQDEVGSEKYTEVETDRQNLTGKTGATATAEAKKYDGYTFDSNNTKNVTTGTIAADGSLVLELYYKVDEIKDQPNGPVDPVGPNDIPDDEDQYTIRFVDYDDKLISSAKYAWGTEAGRIVKPADPTRDGYDFTGWTPEIAKVTGPATYKAQYEPITYTIIYHSNYQSVVSTETEDDPIAVENVTTIVTFNDVLGPNNQKFSKTSPWTNGNKTYTFAGWKDANGKEYPLGAYNGVGAILEGQTSGNDQQPATNEAGAVNTATSSLRSGLRMAFTTSFGGTLELWAQWTESTSGGGNNPRPRPNPNPTPAEEEETIDDGDTPLAPAEEEEPIDDGDTPLAPYEEDTEIDEEATPLSPFTGDDRHTAVWGFVSLLSLAGIVVVARKRREEE